MTESQCGSVDPNAAEIKMLAVAPRPPSAQERALLDYLVKASESPELAEQISRVEVVSTCSCGCPSVGLNAEGPPVTSETVTRLAAWDRHDVQVVGDHLIVVRAVGQNRAGQEVEVILHVVLGLAEELELWAGTWGGDVRTDLPAVDTLRPWG